MPRRRSRGRGGSDNDTTHSSITLAEMADMLGAFMGPPAASSGAGRASARARTPPRGGPRVRPFSAAPAPYAAAPSAPPAPAGLAAAATASGSGTRAEVERLRAELEALKLAKTVGRPATTSSATRAEVERLRKELDENHKLRGTELADLERLRRKEAERKDVSELQAKIERLFKAATAVEVAFVVDVTGSMGTWIKAVKEQVQSMVTDWSTRLGTSFRVAFVGYRDYSDIPGLQTLGFTTDLGQFKTWVGGLAATGGGDTAEDVFSGLEAAAGLAWGKDTAKTVYHIADAPCHGTSFHDGVSDDHPHGDKLGRSAQALLKRLKGLGVQLYHFGHLNSSTKKMVREFKRLVGDTDDKDPWIMEDTLSASDPGQLRKSVFAAVGSSLGKSVSASLAVAGKGAGAMKARIPIDPRKFDEINWKDIEKLKGRRIKHWLPESMESLLRSIAEKEPLLEDTRPITVQVYHSAFSDDGATRLPFYTRVCGKPGKYVAKVFRRAGAIENSLTRYKQQAEIQAVAAFMAQQFNKTVVNKAVARAAGLSGVPEVKYTMATTLNLTKEGAPDKNYNLEVFIEGAELIKFNSNFGWVRPYTKLVQAFSHWSWHASGGKLMVVDVQGIWDKGRGQFTLFDPVCHCTDLSRFQSSTGTNLGSRGMDAFFLSHKCSNICKALALPKHRMQPEL